MHKAPAAARVLPASSAAQGLSQGRLQAHRLGTHSIALLDTATAENTQSRSRSSKPLYCPVTPDVLRSREIRGGDKRWTERGQTPVSAMEQPPVQIGQYVLGKNLGIGAFGKVRRSRFALLRLQNFPKRGPCRECAVDSKLPQYGVHITLA